MPRVPWEAPETLGPLHCPCSSRGSTANAVTPGWWESSLPLWAGTPSLASSPLPTPGRTVPPGSCSQPCRVPPPTGPNLASWGLSSPHSQPPEQLASFGPALSSVTVMEGPPRPASSSTTQLPAFRSCTRPSRLSSSVTFPGSFEGQGVSALCPDSPRTGPHWDPRGRTVCSLNTVAVHAGHLAASYAEASVAVGSGMSHVSWVTWVGLGLLGS